MLSAAAVPALFLLIYNFGIVGHYAGAYGLVGKATFFQHNLFYGLAVLLFSPAKGLFVFSPFLLVIPFRLPQIFADRRTRAITAAVGIAAVVLLLVYSKADWRQGASWGPRWLTDLLPIVFWMLPPGKLIESRWTHRIRASMLRGDCDRGNWSILVHGRH